MGHEKKDFRKLYEDLVKSDWFKKAYHNKSLGECPIVVEELEESEDERIMKDIIASVEWNSGLTQERKAKIYAYLKKQKEATCFAELMNKLTATEQEVMFNAWPKEEKEQKHPNGCFTCDEYKKGYEAGRLNGFTAGYNKAMKEVNQKEQKPWKVGANAYFTPEQKPTSTEDMPYITDEHFFEREPADSFKYKLAEYMTRCCTKREGPYGYEYGLSAETILKMAEEELLKRGVVQKPVEYGDEFITEAEEYASKVNCGEYKVEVTEAYIAGALRANNKPAEWSEEDEEMYSRIVRRYTDYEGIIMRTKEESVANKMLGAMAQEETWLNNRFKSLRPSWKPSEEQMEALKCAVEDVAKFSKRGGRQVELENEPYYRALHSLYCNLEKLM